MPVTLVNFPPDILPDVPGLTLPTVDSHTYELVDNDAKVCRVLAEDEFQASYVDNNIQTFQLQDLNLLTLDVDNHDVTLTYTSAAQTALRLGSIDYQGGARTELYGKTNGIIYPIDESGTLLLNSTNTPNLVAIRTWYANEAQRVNDQRLQIAEVVHAFAEAIGGLAHAGEASAGTGADSTGT